jgi:hypothetical protein
MRQQRETIWNGLQDLSNATAAGGECWVTFMANGNEHWVQCTPDRVRMDWPFSTSPDQNAGLKACFGSGGELAIDAWEVDSYVTFVPVLKTADALVAAIDSAFCDLYGLGPSYTVRYAVEGASTQT